MKELNLSSVLCKAASKLGYPTLKVEQEQAITYFISGNDVLVSLSTGYGKSLCFATLPKVFDLLRDEHKVIVLVITPLLSLYLTRWFLSKEWEFLQPLWEILASFYLTRISVLYPRVEKSVVQ